MDKQLTQCDPASLGRFIQGFTSEGVRGKEKKTPARNLQVQQSIARKNMVPGRTVTAGGGRTIGEGKRGESTRSRVSLACLRFCGIVVVPQDQFLIQLKFWQGEKDHTRPADVRRTKFFKKTNRQYGEFSPPSKNLEKRGRAP